MDYGQGQGATLGGGEGEGDLGRECWVWCACNGLGGRARLAGAGWMGWSERKGVGGGN
jgi:hypothetical protein